MFLVCFGMSLSAIAQTQSYDTRSSENPVLGNEWSFDSCMENVIRQFSCKVDGRTIAIDLEKRSTKLAFKTKSGSQNTEKILGILIKNKKFGDIYISCDDSGTLENVQLIKNKKAKKINCN